MEVQIYSPNLNFNTFHNTRDISVCNMRLSHLGISLNNVTDRNHDETKTFSWALIDHITYCIAKDSSL